MSCYGSKPQSFLRMQPSGQIPASSIDGIVYNQSNDIIFALEREFPDHKAPVPTEPARRERMQELTRLERELFSAWTRYLTGNDLGERARSSFKSVLSRIDSALVASPSGDFFLGDEVSLVDLLFASFFERTVASLIRAVPGAATNPYPSLQILAFVLLGYTVVYPRVLSWITSRPVH